MPETEAKKFNFFYKGSDIGVQLIHGITGTPSEMHFLGKKLHKKGFTVFCNSLPRHCGTLNDLKKVTWGEIADSSAEDFLRLKKECRQVFVAGLSMGALMAIHLAYQFPSEVSGIVALAPTLFYDGWALHKGKAVLELLWHIPFIRNAVNIREGWPYGLKDEDLRWSVERFYKNAKSSEFSNKSLLFGSPFFPAACLYQHRLFTKVAKKEIPEVKNPILIMHAKEDDMTSPKNAEYVLNHIGSSDKGLVLLDDSYHMITIDKQKELVASEIIKFLERVNGL